MTTPVTDLSFNEYTDRQYRELEPERLLERALAVQTAGSSQRRLTGWEPQPYPGFAVVSMVDENRGNETLRDGAESIQESLLALCPWKDSLYLLPVASFHQTIANTLSAERFLHHIQRPGLEPVYPSIVDGAFGRIAAPVQKGPIRMEMIGVGILGNALALLGVFEQAGYYDQIVHFRSGFYADEGLKKLDVKRTRPFIGHITLAYVEAMLTRGMREQLAEAVDKINQSLVGAPLSFLLSHTELRRYETLSSFTRKDGYPRYQF